jgi:hypothetical protein
VADVTVPTAPALATVADVELMHTGTWDLSTGQFTFTVDDLAGAVASQDCPAVRRPVLKLGHCDPRFDGEPAVGWIANMATAENGRTLVGDYTGMPGWLGDVIASAFPDRSIEGEYDFHCQMGHTHPFVVTAVALLGVNAPGVGTLQSLQDVAALYGVAAAAPPTGTAFTVKGAAMPNPTPTTVAAGVTTEDVRRAFYSSPAGQGWDVWIEEMQLDPMQLITVDDGSGVRARIPVTIGTGDGEEAVTFGDPVPVLITYVDKATPTGVAAAARRQGAVVFASKAESRPDAPQTPAATAGGQPEGKEPAVETDELAVLRTELGLADDASFADVHAAIKAGKTQQESPPEPAPAGDPVSDPAPAADIEATVAAAVAAAIEPWKKRVEETTGDLATIKASAAADTKRTVFDGAIRAGKLTPADRAAWEARYDQAPAVVTEILASTAEGAAVPVHLIGQPGGDEDASDLDAEFAHLYPPAPAGRGV